MHAKIPAPKQQPPYYMQTITDHSSSEVARSFRARPPERSLSGRAPSEKLLLNHSISNKRKLLTTSGFWIGGKRPKTRLKPHTQFFKNPFSLSPSLSRFLPSLPLSSSSSSPELLRTHAHNSKRRKAPKPKEYLLSPFSPALISRLRRDSPSVWIRLERPSFSFLFQRCERGQHTHTLLSLSLSNKTWLFRDRNISSGVESHAPGKWLTISDWIVESVCSFQPTKACHLCESNWNGHLFSFSDYVNEENTDTLRLDWSRTEPSVLELNLLWLTIQDWFVEFNCPFQLQLARHPVWNQLERRSFIFQYRTIRSPVESAPEYDW